MVGSSQDALILPRALFSTPRVHHLLWWSPSVDHAALTTFDELLRSALSQITNLNLTDTVVASKPTDQGWWSGVRRFALLDPPAFLTSAAGTISLQHAILDRYACPTNSFFERSVILGRKRLGHHPPPPMSCTASLSGQAGHSARSNCSRIWPGHL